MDPIILILVGLALIVGVALLLIGRNKKETETNERNLEQENRIANRNLPARAGANRNIPRNRLRNRNVRHHQNNDDQENEYDDEDEIQNGQRGNYGDDMDFEDEQDREELRKKIGTKKLAKLEEKEMRRERNAQLLREREERKEREEKLYQERKRKEAEEERLEKEKEEMEKKLKEEKERQEYEEYLKLKEQFSVEEEGQDAESSDLDSQSLLNAFVNFIKESKVVVLEDLAAEFKLKTQDTINRINQVEEMGLLTGVMDDRGKYIYISEEEMLKFKTFIEQRGRVNIGELVRSSNQLINIKPLNIENVTEQVN